MVITRASQARDEGSIPFARFFKSLLFKEIKKVDSHELSGLVQV